MNSLMALLEHHTYAVTFVWVLIEQGGVPIPSVPVMLAVGTMSAAHRLHIAYMLPVIMLACLIADSVWYLLGRRFGTRILNVLCRFSLEAATCVNRTQGTVARRGAVTLLFAKFVPGLSTVAAPIVGQAGVSYATFAMYDMAGTVFWAGAWLFAGRFFGDIARRSGHLFAMLAHFGILLVLVMVAALLAYRLLKRRQFLSELRGLRLEPAQLLAMMRDAEQNGHEPPFIVDLRHPLDVMTDPLVLPGALRIGPDELKRRKHLIPVDRDVILYCTCPSEETSAKVALDLRRMGVRRVRPLRGGLQGWKEAGYPVNDAVFS